MRNSQRGIGIIGFIVLCFLLAGAFKVGAMVQARETMKDLDALFEQVCDTSSKTTDYVLQGSTKVYTCKFLRNMTPEEIARHKNEVDESIGDVDKPKK